MLLDRLEQQPSASLWKELADDDLVRAEPAALAALHRLVRARLPGMVGAELRGHVPAALAFAGYTLWAITSLDFSDEHYHLGCPHCATRLVIVIGDYGYYAAIRDEWAGDVERIPLRAASPAALDGIGRWMSTPPSPAAIPSLPRG